MKCAPKFNSAVKLTREGIELGDACEVLLCGSLFYFRLPRAVWKDRIEKLKRAGYNCVDVYFPWNYHEREDGSFSFEGERDVRYFLEELRAAGLYVIARPGPYICSEWNGGALPARVLESGMPIRCAADEFIAETEKWYAAVLPQIAPFSFARGGNVILIQLENELDFFDCPDPEAYIGRLRDIAQKYINDVPYFCCAGQYDVRRAGGFTSGVEATLNCYPDSADATFDGELQAYALKFAERDKPLLVSETNRDHFLLRRELSCGAKLLGAYNQVAGVNFDYNQAVNNWGKPDAMLATLYDFASMIDPAGNYRNEAQEAALFAAFMKTAGQALARALPSPRAIQPESCSFITVDGGLRALHLHGGGVAVCVPNFSQDKGEIRFVCANKSVQAEVLPMHAPFFLFDFPLAAHGINAVLTRANCEPIYADRNTLVFYAEGTPLVGLDFGDGETVLCADETVHGVRVVFENKERALRRVCGENPPEEKEYTATPVASFYTAALPVAQKVQAGKAMHFGALGVREGAVVYSLALPAGKPLFIEGPCDFMRVTADGACGETFYADGRDKVIPAAKTGRYEVRIEKWGHSNFDDPQSPTLRTSCKKGAVSFGVVEEQQKVGRCDFRLLEEYGAPVIALDGELPVRLGVDKWNSTRKPAICSYTLPVRRKAERLLLKTAESTDIAVYVDGKLAGECDFGSFELTPYVADGKEHALTLVYRKRVWTQECGAATLLHVSAVQPAEIRAITQKEMIAMAGKGKKMPLPIRVENTAALYANVRVQKESRLRFAGKNVLLTCVMDGRVIGRAIVNWANAPVLTGGEPEEIYLCPAWSGDLFIYAQALGQDAVITGAELLFVR